MENPKGRLANVVGVLFSLYFTIGVFSAVYFNYTYARDNGFVKWLLLGQIVPTAKAMIWPYFVLARDDAARNAQAPKELPHSIKNFFLVTDILSRANETSNDSINTPDLRTRVAVVSKMLQEAIDSSATIDRAELNRVQPGLGDHFLDEEVGGAKLTVRAINERNQDLVLRAQASYIRWSEYWNANGSTVFHNIAATYNLETRGGP